MTQSSVVSVHYTRSFGPMGSALLEVVRDGDSTLMVSYNADGHPAIGTWRHAIAASKFDELVRRVDASGYHQGTWPAPPFPGGPSFGVRRAGEKSPAMRDFIDGQPEVKDVMALLSELMDELRRHPVQVLQGRARWKNDSPTPELEVILTNAGARPISFVHSNVRVSITRPSGDELTVDAAEVHATGAAKTAAVTLAPGESVSFVVRAKLSLRPGRYPARLVVAIQPAHGADRLEGNLQLDPGPLTLQP